MSVFKLIFKEMYTLLLSSLGMITALAWNTAFQNFFNSEPVLKKYGPWVYAIVVTIITILLVILLTQILKFDIKDINKTLNSLK